MLQAVLNLLPKRNTPGQLNKKKGNKLQKEAQARKEDAMKIGCHEAFRKSNTIKDEAMTANDKVIAMLKETLARQNSEGNDRANQAENEKAKNIREAKAKR
jgi:hypothetical protein